MNMWMKKFTDIAGRIVATFIVNALAIISGAAVVLFPFRPAYYDKDQPPIEDAELIIAKNRHGESGIIAATFDGKLTKYTEVAI